MYAGRNNAHRHRHEWDFDGRAVGSGCLRESLLEGGLARSGLFNQGYLEQLVTDHQSGLREYSAPLWSLLMFQAAIANDDFTVR